MLLLSELYVVLLRTTGGESLISLSLLGSSYQTEAYLVEFGLLSSLRTRNHMPC